MQKLLTKTSIIDLFDSNIRQKNSIRLIKIPPMSDSHSCIHATHSYGRAPFHQIKVLMRLDLPLSVAPKKTVNRSIHTSEIEKLRTSLK